MKLIPFELKKIWKQKKIVWFFLILMIGTIYLFRYNDERQIIEILDELKKVDEYSYAVQSNMGNIDRQIYGGVQDENLLLQREYVIKSGYATYYWRDLLGKRKWDEVPKHIDSFLKNIEQFEKAGGKYHALEGIEREIAIKKNNDLLQKNLGFELEEYPTSPHLILKQICTIFTGPMGVIILLFFLGTTIIQEKEQKTLLTLKTQPISRSVLYSSKFLSVMFYALVYLVFIFVVGLSIPLILGEEPLHLNYPQVTLNGDEVVILTTLSYCLRTFAFFLCAMVFSFSLIMFVSLRMNNTFNTLLVTFTVIAAGYALTSWISVLQNPLNPFYLFLNEHILQEAPGFKDILYWLSSLSIGLVFFFLSMYLPEKDLSLIDSKNMKQPFRKGKTGKRKSTLASLLLFEGRKEIRKGNVRLVLIILVPLLVFSYVRIFETAREKEEQYLSNLEKTNLNFWINNFEEMIANYEMELEAAKNESDDALIEFFEAAIKENENKIDFYKEWGDIAKLAAEQYRMGDSQAFLEYQLFESRIERGHFSDVSDIDSSLYYGPFTLDASIAEKEWMIEHNIEPIVTGPILMTIHIPEDFYLNPYSLADIEKNRKVDGSGLYSLYLLFQHNAHFLPMILFVFLVGGGLALEKGKRPTIRFLRTQPASERAIYYGKVLHSFLLSMMVSILLIGLVVFLGTVFDRFGDWHYPIIHYDGVTEIRAEDYPGTISYYYGFQFIPLGEVLVQTFVLFLIGFLLVLSVSHLLSVFFRNSIVVFIVTAIIFIGGYVLSTEFFEEVAHLSPFTYLNVNKVVNGELSTLLDIPELHFSTGMFVLITGVVLINILASITVRRRVG